MSVCSLKGLPRITEPHINAFDLLITVCLHNTHKIKTNVFRSIKITNIKNGNDNSCSWHYFTQGLMFLNMLKSHGISDCLHLYFSAPHEMGKVNKMR